MAENPPADDEISRLRDEIDRLQAQNDKLRASNRRWMRIAGTDDLTGLPNKVFFTTALLPQQISKSEADQTPFACLIVAPDQLGEINQRFGREGGDEVVRGLAEFLKGQLESGERLVHFDGANFVVLIPGGHLPQAKKRALAMRARLVSRPLKIGAEGVSLTLSLGAVSRSPTAPGDSMDAKHIIEQVLRKLVAALDAAKREGRDRLHEDEETEF